MKTINETLVKEIFPKVSDLSGVVKGIQILIDKYQINTPNRLAEFLAQVHHESAGLTILSENLNYSAEGLTKVFGKYFNSTTSVQCARQPEKIANKVYANRMGNGLEASGDGFRYRGRGAIQLTGKDNYKAAGASLGVDLVESPDLVSTFPYALSTAGWFWNSKGLNVLADAQDHLGVCKKVNGGTLGLDDRIAQFNRILPLIS
ncbi:MAG TPA: glycoside hydrolase family 19 protein [Nitrososphaeraceae archaeon]